MAKKKRKKPTLKSQKANPNSKYWKKKADEQWALQIKTVGACEVNSSHVGRLNAHHIISRTRLRYRHDLSNGVCLCTQCHSFNADISPHQDSYGAERFLAWLKKDRPGQFQWYEEHKHDKRQPEKTYQQCYEELTPQQEIKT